MRRLALTLAACVAMAQPLGATDLGDMTAAERQVFRDEVRAYLLDNPEVLMEAIAVLETRDASAQETNDQSLVAVNAAALFDDGYSYVGGNLEGDVTIVEFLDYNCGYCKKAHPEVTALLKTDGNIRYIVKEFPILGEESVLASQFAISVKNIAGDAAYAQVHDQMMAMRGGFNEAGLRRLSDHLGLDTDAVLAEMSTPEVAEVIRQNRALAQRMQINGTPSFIMGDQMLRGYVPLAGMQQIVADLRG